MRLGSKLLISLAFSLTSVSSLSSPSEGKSRARLELSTQFSVEELKAPIRHYKKDKKPKRGTPPTALILPTTSIDSPECTKVQESFLKAGFSNVSVVCDETYAYVQSDTYPEHDVMNGITGTNEQIPVPASQYVAPIRLSPEKAKSYTSIDAALGIAINGVPIYDYSAQGELNPERYQSTKDTVKLGQLDQCGGHAGRGDDYHYHAKPICMIESMPEWGDSSIIGWGYDGYPLFADRNPNGTQIENGSLDICNGQTDPTYGYRYHTSPQPPYIFQCLVGKVDTKILPRVAPLKGAKARANLKPPKNGVQNLRHIESKDGTRELSYTYLGVEYYSRYTPSKSKPNCYEFVQKTISNNGAIESGTYCR
ncbi:YHYH protein [Vibrio tubiashii]|uniref:YHYH protein n=1 Tax=Vibrio tubiashii TaxID=29498 RepID=UPI001EFC9DC0|nr:YHYH protein [Vibrio tubiashii]MCG9580339.1 YHYH protein [Vibrio tubiashii]MCG9613930.1 YHYH protein [Vibrio tubiashii]MCG9688396.1 YHYH protein [Vibrio tubiashii]